MALHRKFTANRMENKIELEHSITFRWLFLFSHLDRFYEFLDGMFVARLVETDALFMDYARFTDKQFYYIITSDEPQNEAAEGTIKAFRGFLDRLPGAVVASIVYDMGKRGGILTPLNGAYETGKRL